MQVEANFALGDVLLVDGGVLTGASLAYATHGVLSPEGDNCVLIPTYYGGVHASYDAMIGPGRALDPGRRFIVVVDMFGNGLSTSPSHRPPGKARAGFPSVTIADNVACQHRLLTEGLGVRRIQLVTGWSMGAMQALWWVALYPQMVDALLPVCGTASCWPMNQAFLAGVCGALQADARFAGGRYARPPERGLRAFGRAYAGWAYSAAFFREQLYRTLGHDSLEALLQAWEADHLAWDACDLMAMAATWRSADIGSVAVDGAFRTALGRIAARTIVMPCDTDAYFTADECRIEAAAIANSGVRLIRSPYGHCAGAPGRFPRETAMIEAAIGELLR